MAERTPRGPRGPQAVAAERPAKMGKVLGRTLGEVWKNYKWHCLGVIVCVIATVAAQLNGTLFL